jgi:hypothetical protein
MLPEQQRLKTPLGKGVHGALASFARLSARREVAKTGESLGLGVVLALTRPGEEPSTPCQAQQIVWPGTLASDEAENLVREQAELGAQASAWGNRWRPSTRR